MNRSEFFKLKKEGYREAERKTLQVLDNGRSADFIIPNFARGCELGCAYCYVGRNNGKANAVTLYTNRQQIWDSVKKHYEKLPAKVANQCDPVRWTYDIGEATDCLSPKIIETTKWFIDRFLADTDAKPTFATKLCVGPKVLAKVPKDRARVRISVMPEQVAKMVEAGTSNMLSRIQSIEPLRALGYEVQLNFSPVIVFDGWEDHYRHLMKTIVATVGYSPIAAEVIFLTHHYGLHMNNMSWIPEGESLMWQPQIQEAKTNERGSSDIVRYQYLYKRKLVDRFKQLLAEEMPNCTIRYIF